MKPISKEILSLVVLNIVNDSTGVKATELVASVVEKVLRDESAKTEREYRIDFDMIAPVIHELVTKGEILEVEYVVPNMNYRIKSMYFPKGTLLGRVKIKLDTNERHVEHL